MKGPKEHYVTLHAKVLQEFTHTVAHNVRERGWTDEDVQLAFQGLFTTCYEAGGCLDTVEQIMGEAEKKIGAPEDAIKH